MSLDRAFLISNFVVLRFIGVGLYSLAASYIIPSALFVDVVVDIVIYEFIFGMLLISMKINAMSGFGNFSSRTAVYSFFLLLIVLYSILNEFTSLYLLLSAVLAPFICEMRIVAERRNFENALSLESYAAMIGNLLAAAILVMVYLIHGDVLSPMARYLILALSIFCGFALFGSFLVFSRLDYKELSVDSIVSTVKSTDYLAAVSFFKASVLSSLESYNPLIVKLVVLIYEPISAVFGFILRFLLNDSSYSGREYRRLVRPFWLFLLILGLAFLSMNFAFPSFFYYSVASYVFLSLFVLLTLAGLTDVFRYSSSIVRVSATIILIALGWMVSYEYINFSSYFIIIAFLYMSPVFFRST